jgi:mono/diheme cytochrome c family protein
MERARIGQPTDLGITRLLGVFAALSVLLLAALAVAPCRSHLTEWRALQKRYNAQAAQIGIAPVEVGIKQIWKPDLGVVDRCTSCHLGMGEAPPSPHERLFSAHPPIPHDPRDFGCTVCHAGQGRATTTKAAHGRVRFWDEPMLERPYLEAGCGTCHSHVPTLGPGLAGAPRLSEGKRLAHRLGCRGCHRIAGVGGDDGPDLSDVGKKRIADLELGVEGAGDLAGWLREHFVDPQRVVPGSQMPNLGLSEEQADLLTVYMLSLRASPVPESLAPKDRVRGMRLGERDFATDGEALFGVFCAACHGPRGEGRRFGALPFTFPAIGSPEFLAVADDEFLRRTITDGRPGRRMPAWGKKDGGLRAEEIDALVAYLRSLKPTAPSRDAFLAAPMDHERGRARYARDCALCHGTSGEGTGLGSPLSAEVEPRFYEALTQGVHGTAMGSYRTYSAHDLRSLLGTVSAFPKGVGSSWKPARGDAARGQTLYAESCAGCHGARGEGAAGPALANPAFLETASDGYLAQTIVRGRGTTTMPHFGEPGPDHRALAPGEVLDLVAFVRSLGGTR